MNTNKLILGTVQFGLNYGINNTTGKPNQDEINEILLQSYKAGIRSLDTAEVYGDTHRIIGDFHNKYPDVVFDVITKLPKVIDSSLTEKIDSYIQELNISKLKAILFHSYDIYKDNVSNIQTLKKYKAQDKIEFIGVSIYTNEQMEDVIKDDNINIIQLPFNLFDNINQRGEILKKAKIRNKIIHTRSAFLQGLFFTPLNKENSFVSALKEELDYIRKISIELNVPIQKIALSYCLQQTYIDNVLIGVDNLEQLNQNISDADYKLPQSIIEKINNIFVKNTDLLNPSLWSR